MNINFSEFWWLRSLRSCHHWIWHLVEGPKDLSGASFIKALIQFIGDPPSWSNDLPKSHLLLPSLWWFGFNLCILGAHKHSNHKAAFDFETIVFIKLIEYNWIEWFSYINFEISVHYLLYKYSLTKREEKVYAQKYFYPTIHLDNVLSIKT